MTKRVIIFLQYF